MARTVVTGLMLATLFDGACSLRDLSELKGGSAAGADASADGAQEGSISTDLPLGWPCTASGDCASGFCVSGVCCDKPCSAPCSACNALLKKDGLDGECGFAAAGTDPSDDCEESAASTCENDGKCDGQGACRKHLDGTECSPQTCVGGTKTLASVCDGKGACLAGAEITCQPATCNGNVCIGDCPNDAACAAGEFCDLASGKCTPKRADGSPCQASKANECASGICEDSVCCNAACASTCTACVQALTGAADGTCAAVSAGTDPNGQCADQGVTSCGTDGACDGSGACRLYSAGAACGAAACTNGAASGQLCDGAGSCVTSPPTSCAPYACSGSACGTTCSSTSQCAPGSFCDTVKKKCQSNGPGCRTGARQAFTDTTSFPNTAACGAAVTYDVAVANAAGTCDDGWHMCTAADMIALANAPVPDGGGAWIEHTDPATTMFGESPESSCSNPPYAANLKGTAGCTSNGVYPEGWRLATSGTVWPRSHESSSGCIPHATHSCGFGGGSMPPAQYFTLCCR